MTSFAERASGAWRLWALVPLIALVAIVSLFATTGGSPGLNSTRRTSNASAGWSSSPARSRFA